MARVPPAGSEELSDGSESLAKARLLCRVGVHARVLSGGGMMGDGLTCVDCGRDKYPEVFGLAVKTLPWPGGRTIDRSPAGRTAAWKRARQIEDHD